MSNLLLLIATITGSSRGIFPDSIREYKSPGRSRFVKLIGVAENAVPMDL